MVRLTKYLALALLAAFSFAACDKPEQPQEEDQPTTGPSASVEIFENLVQAKGEGGQYSFTYMLEGGDISGLEAKCDESWVHSFDLSEEGIVYFTIDANDTGSSRITKVYLSIED